MMKAWIAVGLVIAAGALLASSVTSISGYIPFLDHPKFKKIGTHTAHKSTVDYPAEMTAQQIFEEMDRRGTRPAHLQKPQVNHDDDDDQ